MEIVLRFEFPAWVEKLATAAVCLLERKENPAFIVGQEPDLRTVGICCNCQFCGPGSLAINGVCQKCGKFTAFRESVATAAPAPAPLNPRNRKGNPTGNPQHLKMPTCSACGIQKARRWMIKLDGKYTDICIKCSPTGVVAPTKETLNNISAQLSAPLAEMQRLGPAKKPSIPATAVNYHPYLRLHESFGLVKPFSIQQVSDVLQIGTYTSGRMVQQLVEWKLAKPLGTVNGVSYYQLNPYKEPTINPSGGGNVVKEYTQSLQEEIAGIDNTVLGGKHCREWAHHYNGRRGFRRCTKCGRPYRFGSAMREWFEDRRKRLVQILEQENRHAQIAS